MQQRLQGPAGPSFGVDPKLFCHQFRNDPGYEVVLIGKRGHGQAIRFGPLGQARPIDVGGNVGLANAGERRRDNAMVGATLQRAAASFGRVKVIARITVIDRQGISPGLTEEISQSRSLCVETQSILL